MKKFIVLMAASLFALPLMAATVPQSANGDDGLGVFSSHGGSGTNSGTFTASNADLGGTSWGFFANTGETSQALYDFTGGALTVGQTASIQLDNGSIQTGGTVGIGFQNITNANNRLELFFVGDDSNYTYVDNSGSNDSGVGFTSGGLTLALTLTGTDTYSFDITPIGGSTTNITGTLAGTAGSGIDRIRIFNFNAGTGSGADAYANNISVIPEPSSIIMMGLTGLAAAGLTLLKRRRKA